MSRIGNARQMMTVLTFIAGIAVGGVISYGVYRIHRHTLPPPVVAPERHYVSATVVALGDSITYGYRAPKGADWPSDARRLDPGLSISNRGILGNTVNWPGCKSCDLTLVQRFQRDVLDIPGARTLVILAGVNDIAQGGNAAEIEEGLTIVTREAHAHHIRVIGCTILPYGASGIPKQANTTRVLVNAWILHKSGDDRVLDTATAMEDPEDHSWLNPVYDSGDGTHPNALGYEVLAKVIAPALK